MTLVIELSPDEGARLAQQAARHNLAPDQYVKSLIERDLQPTPSLSEILVPFRREVEESGISDEELEALFQEARDRAFEHRQRLVR